MGEKFSIYVSGKGKEALEKIAAFNADKSKKEIVSELLIAEAKNYKGRKPQKKADEKPSKKAAVTAKKTAKKSC